MTERRRTYYTGIINDGSSVPFAVWVMGRIWYWRRTRAEAEADLQAFGGKRG